MKEKKSRMEIRLSEKDKKNIERYAKKCGVPVSEYVRQCALGYSPRQTLPNVFYDLYSRLCDVCNLIDPGFTPETEQRLVDLISDIRDELMLPGRENASGHLQNGEPFVTCDKSERMERDATWLPPDSGP